MTMSTKTNETQTTKVCLTVQKIMQYSNKKQIHIAKGMIVLAGKFINFTPRNKTKEEFHASDKNFEEDRFQRAEMNHLKSLLSSP